MQKAGRKYYTERQAEERAQEIAREMLKDITNKLSELTQGFVLTIERNRKLTEEARIAKESSERLTHAVIYYDETFNRLPEEMKEKFKEIGKGVIKDYDLPYEK